MSPENPTFEPLAVAGEHASESELRERVKELACLYQVAAAFMEHRSSLADAFTRIAQVLPMAVRFPEWAEASIRLDSLEVPSAGFAGAVERLSADIQVGGRIRGEIQIAYRSAGLPSAAEGPFLREERSLLDALARQIGVFVENVENEERRISIESQLRHADRLATIGQLAAGVAHELNEPLGNILGFAQLAQKVAGVPAQAQADLEKIVRASLHGREITRKLLVFARQAPASKVRVSLNSVVDDALFLLEAGCDRSGIRFRRELQDGLPEIDADPVQVRQVLVNLVVNAMHAIPGAGTITVRTAREGSAVVLSVADTGTGMTPEVAQRAFDPFYTTKDVGHGTGLGLSVVQGIVSGHGGTIELQTAPGAGARFEVRLPIESHA